MSPQECHNCIQKNNVIDLEKDDYVHRVFNEKLVFYHLVCYEAESNGKS